MVFFGSEVGVVVALAQLSSSVVASLSVSVPLVLPALPPALVVVAPVTVGSPGFYADDFRSVPFAVGTTLGGGHVALQEAVCALVAHHGVDVVVGALPTNQEGVINSGRGSAKHCSLLADVGQIIVAGHVVPFAVLVSNHNHAVFSSSEEVVRLVFTPVLILQVHLVGPLKVVLHCAIVQPDPGVVVAQTSDEVLLGHAVDAGQVTAVLPAVLLGVLPGVSAGEVPVAVAVKLPPRVLAALGVFFTSSSTVAGQTKTHKGVDLIDAGSSILAWIRLAVVNVDLAALSREALRTIATIAITFLQAAPAVETRVGLARVILH